MGKVWLSKTGRLHVESGQRLPDVFELTENINLAFKFSDRDEAETDLAEIGRLLREQFPNHKWTVEEKLPFFVICGEPLLKGATDNQHDIHGR